MQNVSDLEKPDMLRVCNAELLADYQKAVNNHPKNGCCSCQRLHQKKNEMKVSEHDFSSKATAGPGEKFVNLY